MPRDSLANVVEARLEDGGGGTRLDLCIDLLRCQCDRFCKGDPFELFGTFGGEWDGVEKRFVGEAATSRRFAYQAAQHEAIRWFVLWRDARRRGEKLPGPDGSPCYTVALVGGRRSGKSWMSITITCAFLVDAPRSIGWIVIPEYPDSPEVERLIEEQLPSEWYVKVGSTNGPITYTLANGSVLEIRSAYDPKDLKRGRCDVAVIHEAQKMPESVYGVLAPAAADEGGLVIIVCNPPDTAKGEWVTDVVDRGRAKLTDERIFELDPRANPHVDQAALRALAKKLDPKTYERDALGLFIPATDRVFYAFSPSAIVGNVREVGRGPAGEALVDVTPVALGRMLGELARGAERAHGLDFQLHPWMAAATARLFEDPEDRSGPPLLWFTDAIQIPQGDEDMLLDALEARGFMNDPVVPDASGAYQGAERIKGRASFDILRRRGWRRIFYPDPRSERNPPVSERHAVMNALFLSGPPGSRRRRCFVDPSAVDLIIALKKWEKRNGAINVRSDYAHICDAASYLAYRLYPRRLPSPPATVTIVKRPGRPEFERI